MHISSGTKEIAKYVGLGAVTGIVGLGLGFSSVAAAAVGFGSMAALAYRNRGRRSSVPALPVSGEVEDAGDALLAFFRHYGVPHYPTQQVADFQAAAGLPVDGR